MAEGTLKVLVAGLEDRTRLRKQEIEGRLGASGLGGVRHQVKL
jgi:hypothetical protein